MADSELMKKLEQGGKVWNRWRKQQRANMPIDLGRAELSGLRLNSTDLRYAVLFNANLNHTDLFDAHLHHADLSHANLSHADLSYADLHGANLRFANLREADLHHANLHEADLRFTNLYEADLHYADLSSANLCKAMLNHTDFYKTNLFQADLSHATLEETIFVQVNLCGVKGLAELNHRGPSRVELHTIQLPQDGSALHFLRGAGVPDEWIDDYRAHAIRPIQYHSCFISYSHQDEDLAHRLHADLQDQGVRCWFAPEDMKIGDRIRSRINEAIHIHEKLLLLLSRYSLTSNWVEDEVEAALEKEENQHREVLFPIRLDNTVM